VLRPKELSSFFKVNLATPLAVAEAATALGVKEVRIKWPNDVWVGSRKVSGVILDTSIQVC
jgi:BirA family transcriptional regulator, biotin operon repressor / biotin---[acetyl-CoA-carboxylase] ligase